MKQWMIAFAVVILARDLTARQCPDQPRESRLLALNPGGGGTIGGDHRTRVPNARQRGGIGAPPVSPSP